MARYEQEGYCPYNAVWRELRVGKIDHRLIGLWEMIGPSIVYETMNESGAPTLLDSENCNTLFCRDPIAYRVMGAIIRKNPQKIMVRQDGRQSLASIREILTAESNAELVIEAGSSFAVVLAEADYGLDLWVWNLREVVS